MVVVCVAVFVAVVVVVVAVILVLFIGGGIVSGVVVCHWHDCFVICDVVATVVT